MKSSTYAGLLALALGAVTADLTPCPATPPVCGVKISNGPNHHLKCLEKGVLENPSTSGEQALEACGAITEADCRNSCLYTMRCHSYGFDEVTKVCSMSTSTLRMQKFQQRLTGDTIYSSSQCYTPTVLDHPGDEAFTALGGDMGMGRGMRTYMHSADGDFIEPNQYIDMPEYGADSACDAIEKCAGHAETAEPSIFNIHWSLHKGMYVCKYWRGLDMSSYPTLHPNLDVGQYWNYENVMVV